MLLMHVMAFGFYDESVLKVVYIQKWTVVNYSFSISSGGEYFGILVGLLSKKCICILFPFYIVDVPDKFFALSDINGD